MIKKMRPFSRYRIPNVVITKKKNSKQLINHLVTFFSFQSFHDRLVKINIQKIYIYVIIIIFWWKRWKMTDFFFFFFYQDFLSQTLTTHRTAGEGRGPFLFHSTTSTRSRTFRYLFATLHVRWLSHIFNRTACIY